MSIFKDLTSPEIQPFIEENIFSSEIKLDNEMKSLLTDFFKKNKATDVNVGDYTSHVKFSNGNSTVFPNQYYAIASACFDYATELSKYCSFCKEFVNTEKNKTKLLETKGDKQLVSDLLYEIIGDRLEEIDREMFEKFYCDEKYRPGRSFFNKDSIRNTDDIFDSNLLKIIHVPDASSSFLGKLIRMLVESNDVYSSLNDYIKKIQNISISTTQLNVSSPFAPSQIIYYGVPGCGKSNKIKELLQDVPEKNKIRVVFHPEYTNADFIGQILPKVNGHVTYEFTAGPFAQIIKRAYLNPSEKFYLVIEEINRGNAAAIFGDTFQLLDRLKTGEKDSLGNDSANANVNTFTEGWSQYFVQNDDVNDYIRKAVQTADGKYEESAENTLTEIEINGIHFTANTAIRLPPNLSILATMNTSDQNVFTLDNAFQRRFDMELVRNEFDMTLPAVSTQYNAEIDDSGITWGKFWSWINDKITATLKGLSSTEDKRLGVWFVSNVNGKIDDKIFAEKVLKYLWDDVFKFKRKDVFADEIDTLEKLIDKFEKAEGAARFDVFKNNATLNG